MRNVLINTALTQDAHKHTKIQWKHVVKSKNRLNSQQKSIE